MIESIELSFTQLINDAVDTFVVVWLGLWIPCAIECRPMYIAYIGGFHHVFSCS